MGRNTARAVANSPKPVSKQVAARRKMSASAPPHKGSPLDGVSNAGSSARVAMLSTNEKAICPNEMSHSVRREGSVRGVLAREALATRRAADPDPRAAVPAKAIQRAGFTNRR